MLRYFLFAGEVSGDLHGSRLIQALKAEKHLISLFGVGGPRMRQEGLNCCLQMEDFQVMGFSDVIQSFPRLYQLFYQTRDIILKSQPDCVILIDYPGFNLRLAKALRKQGYKGKIVQYICPTVWAHGKKRIDVLVKYFDLLLTIFPFEASYFDHTSLKVKYMGHPLAETIKHYSYQNDWKFQLGIPKDQSLIALFPGSRQSEIQLHVPQQLQAAEFIKQRQPQLKFAISCAQDHLKDQILQLTQQSSLKLNEDLYFVPACYHYELMKDCMLALAKSGTVTLELAFHHVPAVVHYELPLLNYWIAKYILRLKLPYYCIVNILKKEKVFPEFIGRKLSPFLLSQEIEKLYLDAKKRENIQSICQDIQRDLEKTSSYLEAAKAIGELVYAKAL